LEIISCPKPIKEPKKKKRKKKPEHKRLEEQCLVLWALCVKARDRVCRHCNTGSGLQAHHIRSVSHHFTMFDPSNGLTICNRLHCQQKFNPEKFQDEIINIIGQPFYEEVKQRSSVVIDYSIEDLREIKERLKNNLKRIKEL
jgi:hypothetical protein